VPVGGAVDGLRELPQEHGDEALVGGVGAAGEVVEGGVEGLARDAGVRNDARDRHRGVAVVGDELGVGRHRVLDEAEATVGVPPPGS
jgi:hypothetical protein